MMKPIGGFFELEIPVKEGHFHPNALALSTGRSCLNAILHAVKPHRLYLPFYVCDTLLNVCQSNQVEPVFYGLDKNLAPLEFPLLSEDEYFLYINYWGLQEDNIALLESNYGSQLIVDNVQAFFQPALNQAWSFNSARKFFGVPDGAYLYAQTDLTLSLEPNSNAQIQHLLLRLTGNQPLAYQYYLESEASLSADVQGISTLSERLLSGIDYLAVKRRRQKNFQIYQEAFGELNEMDISLTSHHMVPFCYPLLLEHAVEKQRLFDQQIFIPTYWPEMLERSEVGYDFEKKLVTHLLPLPLDHRYDDVDCKRVITAIQQLLTQRAVG